MATITFFLSRARVTGMFLIDTLLARDYVAFKDAAAHIVLPLVTLTLVTPFPW